jgi:hypothetical protein
MNSVAQAVINGCIKSEKRKRKRIYINIFYKK